MFLQIKSFFMHMIRLISSYILLICTKVGFCAYICLNLTFGNVYVIGNMGNLSLPVMPAIFDNAQALSAKKIKHYF
jgi:hypothetical protein